MNFSVTKNGKPLSKNLYTWDEKTRTFSTKENNLVLDFSGINGVTFNTGSGCIFDTGSGCNFKTGSYCTFNTGSGCVVIRRDIYEVIELKKNQTIKLNDYGIKGYKVIQDKKVITIDGKDIELSNESFESLKEFCEKIFSK